MNPFGKLRFQIILKRQTRYWNFNVHGKINITVESCATPHMQYNMFFHTYDTWCMKKPQHCGGETFFTN